MVGMSILLDDNRRKYARLDLALSVSYRVQGESGVFHDPRETLSSDVSVGGLRLMTPAPLANGTILDLQITLEGSEEEPLTATGEVAWQSQLGPNSFETGVLIQEMPNADKSRFMQFVFDQMAKLVMPNVRN